MLNDLSRRYLQELRTAQKNIDSSRLKEETQDGTDHEVLETHTSEYNLELGPLKVNVKKTNRSPTNNGVACGDAFEPPKDCCLPCSFDLVS